MKKTIQKVWGYKNRKCVILWVRTHFCAYVETKLNIGYGEELGDYGTSPDSNIYAHGGLTFAGELDKDIKDKKWYFGMDFGHYGDFIDDECGSLRDGHKWTLEEVEKETEKMADSIIKYEKIYPKLKKAYKEYQQKTKEILK